MTDDPQSNATMAEGQPLDSLLRDVLPQVKYALGDLIDRENARSLPGRYAKMLPETLLVVTLRPDAADAIAPVAAELERELTDSCTRHGSLYDRSYRVQMRRTEDADAPLYHASAHAGQNLAPAAPAEPDEAEPAASTGATREAAPRRMPAADPDATQMGGFGPDDWEPGRWVLVVQDEAGEEREVFRLTEPLTTVGRRADDPQLRASVALSDVPHMSRRQLALVWQPRDDAPGFTVYNLGLPPVHLPNLEIPGARVGRGALRLDAVPDENTGWFPPGVPLRIADQGPVLRIEEVPEEPEEDPDATVYE